MHVHPIGVSTLWRGAHDATRVLVLGGRPIEEDVIFYGPFAMNTPQEIRQAIADFTAGTVGVLQ